ncbi:PREDICTED: uncharacterized protein LOC109184996 [Ipomoea nil]|uniref:uncharacterized protein LOC109184996 n=1 Tax=Ipomoea nil TaxID=35883 RepID=UPI0009013159|nr:PREDICTED: uncharacterized protein LOC109184996 [Ipomoea nil]
MAGSSVKRSKRRRGSSFSVGQGDFAVDPVVAVLEEPVVAVDVVAPLPRTDAAEGPPQPAQPAPVLDGSDVEPNEVDEALFPPLKIRVFLKHLVKLMKRFNACQRIMFLVASFVCSWMFVWFMNFHVDIACYICIPYFTFNLWLFFFSL